MMTIQIGGRELAVRQRHAPGGLGFLKELLVAEDAVQKAGPLDFPDRAADVVLVYLGQNEGVTREWLLAQLPADVGEVMRELIVASGGRVAAPGEAKSQ